MLNLRAPNYQVVGVWDSFLCQYSFWIDCFPTYPYLDRGQETG